VACRGLGQISVDYAVISPPGKETPMSLPGPQEIGSIRDSHHGKNGFVTATKLGTTNKIFVAATKNFAAATKLFVDRTKHFVVVAKYFCYPYFYK